ncbi:hypothetical protein HRI_005091700 [Hibiscus trionum]|uniref:Uncharacterized protein n=1 Tax=Hibiscus trionum TaxID=183268 RepID=A0A9W7JGR2_HIBTR|nr:hypothetical protein HRI_005091700 [Hibiscus trionum]
MNTPNGQWGVFLHVGDESAGAVVYRGKNKDGQDCDWMQAWRNTMKSNKAYSEVRGVDHWKFKHAGVWAVVAEKMGDSNLMNVEKHDGGCSIVTVGRAPTSIYEAVLTHPNISPF